MPFCEHCGSPLPDNAVFCTECGARVTPAAPTPEPPQTEPAYAPPQPAYVPPEEAAPQPVYTPPQPAYVPPQQPVYTPPQPAYTPPQQQGYTQFTQPAGGYTPPGGGYTPPQSPTPPAKKNKKTLLIVLIIVGVLVLAAVALIVIGLLADRDDGASAYGMDEYVGSWEAQTYKMAGIEVSTDDVGASSMTLNADGSMVLTLMDEDIAGMTWTTTDDGIRVSAGSLKYDAEYDDGELVMDVTAFKVIFVRAQTAAKPGASSGGSVGGSIGGGTDAPAATDEPGVTGGVSGAFGQKPETTDEPGDATPSQTAGSAAEQWNGYWFGSFWVKETFGDEWADMEDSFIDFYGYIKVDEDGYGWLDANDIDLDEVGDEGIIMSMYIQADAEHFEQVGEDAWFTNMVIVEGENGLDYTVYPVDGNPDMFLIEATYVDPDYPDSEEGFDFVITFLRWGCEWDYSVDSVDPPGYEDYLASLG